MAALACVVCGEPHAAESKSCSLCGTSISNEANSTTVPASPAEGPFDAALDPADSSSAVSPQSVSAEEGPRAGAASGSRVCPDCDMTYGSEYADSFCVCGAELQARDLASSNPPIPANPPAVAPALAQRPPAGSPCLVVYSKDRQPLCYHVLNKDVVMIGRSDPVRGDFPDLDLAELVAPEEARRISRKHAIVLRSRESQSFVLRPLAKNTGTQFERVLAADLVDYPLIDGSRLVLGGIVRIKFEIMK